MMSKNIYTFGFHVTCTIYMHGNYIFSVVWTTPELQKKDQTESTSVMRIPGRLCYISAPKRQLNFVPSSKPVEQADIDQLQEFIHNAKRLLVLTGAGLSTESGIPDYRLQNNKVIYD